ncbi:MetS family NSS transporter small subunit [Leucobacter denitrificans]|uniref:MetS family NSS transporter small subunit n=1 Tax=Leucobacter denitrificans TaxID=683042 RepID=A0A7G9S4T4_9MICO|nr:MetS family NSS transporter small subunit [Leucobacter denitrificans]QNN62859.1 MetS family NSS transporter small subunit [Leucobacter denitrificans]
MTPIAIVFLVIALIIIWGGMFASIIMLSRKSEIDVYPGGGKDVFGD